MVSANSKFDQWRRGETFLTDAEFSEYEIFLREGSDPETTPGGEFGGDCFHCHGGRPAIRRLPVPATTGWTARSQPTPGHAGVTGSLDSGKFKTPTLRNIALTGPYMHDGRFQTLEEVIDHYNSGGVPSTTVDPFMKYSTGGLQLSSVQKAQLTAFLHTLTDTSFTTNPAFQDPH